MARFSQYVWKVYYFMTMNIDFKEDIFALDYKLHFLSKHIETI